MPLPRRKKRASTPTTDNHDREESTTMASIAATSSPVQNTPGKDPLRRVNGGAVTKRFKTVTIENLNLEIAERVRKQRSLYETQGRLLRQRIEMRINRIPKHFWKMTMGELLLSEARAQTSTAGELGTLKKLVEDVRRSSREETVVAQEERIVVTKKRPVPKKAPPSTAREQMPPPGPSSTIFSSSPGKTTISVSSPPARPPLSPIKPAPTKSARQKRPATAASHRAQSRATARTSIETAATSASADVGYANTRGTKSSQAKSNPLGSSTNSVPGLKRGGVKGVGGSNGSLKENKVAGVKEPAQKGRSRTNTTTSGTGRVLRSRK